MGMSKNCEYCGESFTPAKQAGNRQRFCSETCQRAWWSENQETAGKKFIFTCGHCGKEYKTRHSDRNQYCSRECAYADRKAKAKLFFCRACGKKTDGSTYCSKDCEYSNELVCHQCGKTYLGRFRSVYCSDECRKEIARIKAVEYERENFIGKEVSCKECGFSFVTAYGSKRREFCSDKCLKRFGKRLRRYRMRGAIIKEHVSLIYLFKRDRSICYLCGEVVEKRLPILDPMAATIDHVIPISRGGKHSKTNTKLAHRICNSKKGNRLVITQTQMELQA